MKYLKYYALELPIILSFTKRCALWKLESVILCHLLFLIHLDHVTSLIFIFLLEFQAKNGAEWWSGNFHLEYRDTYVFFLQFILVPCRNFDFSIVFVYISSKHLLKYGTKIGVSKLVLKFNSYIQFYTSYIYL